MCTFSPCTNLSNTLLIRDRNETFGTWPTFGGRSLKYASCSYVQWTSGAGPCIPYYSKRCPKVVPVSLPGYGELTLYSKELPSQVLGWYSHNTSLSNEPSLSVSLFFSLFSLLSLFLLSLSLSLFLSLYKSIGIAQQSGLVSGSRRCEAKPLRSRACPHIPNLAAAERRLSCPASQEIVPECWSIAHQPALT
jgi:hypothetical protein